MEDSKKKRGGCARALFIMAAAALLSIGAATLAVCRYAERASIPEISFDVSPYLTDDAARLVENKRISAKLSIKRSVREDFMLSATGTLLDWPYSASAHISLGFFRAKGDFSAALDDTDIKLVGDFDIRSRKKWRIAAHVPEARFSSEDAVLGQILPRLELTAVSNIVCRGKVSLSADGRSTDEKPIPEWTVRGVISGVDAALVANDRPISARNLRMNFGVSGIADRHDINPMFPRIDSVEVAGVLFTNVYAIIRATETAYLVTEAGAGCAGGDLKMFSLFLDPVRLSAGATIYVEDVDAGEALAYASGLRGEATGRLHGKVSFFLKDGKTLQLKDAYLFSNPGEGGTVKIYDGKPLIDNLAIGGLPEDACRNLSMALANLNYSVLRFKLGKDRNTGGSTLSLKITGDATHERTTVPVNLDVTLRGDIDQLINTGMRISRRKK